MIEISKELLSEVLRKEILSIQDEDRYIGFKETGVDYGLAECELIYLSDFAFINCKEWAIKKNCYINSIYNEFWWDRIEKKYFADIPNKNKSFYADTEIEAIVKACEWILKETNAK